MRPFFKKENSGFYICQAILTQDMDFISKRLFYPSDSVEQNDLIEPWYDSDHMGEVETEVLILITRAAIFVVTGNNFNIATVYTVDMG